MKIPGLRNGVEKTSGMAYFARMLDKIRLHAGGALPDDYNLGTGFDARCVEFLGVAYEALKERTLKGGSDEEVLAWCHEAGRKPTDFEVMMWNAWVSKRGWRDEQSERVAKMKKERGWQDRDDIQTMFDYHRADEA